MAATVVQSNSGSAGTSATVAFAAASVAGHTIVLAVAVDSGATITGVPAGFVTAAAEQGTGSPLAGHALYFYPGAPAQTTVATLGTSGSSIQWVLAEVNFGTGTSAALDGAVAQYLNTGYNSVTSAGPAAMSAPLAAATDTLFSWGYSPGASASGWTSLASPNGHTLLWRPATSGDTTTAPSLTLTISPASSAAFDLLAIKATSGTSYSGNGTGSVTVTAAASGMPRPAGSGTGSLNLTAAGAGAPSASGTGTAALTATGSAAGTPRPAGTGIASIALSGTANGTAASTVYSGSGTAALSLAGAASGQPSIAGAGSAAVALGAGAVGSGPPPLVYPSATSAGGLTRPWTYIFQDVVTGALLGRVPLQGATFTSTLNDAGNLQGTLLLSDPGVRSALAGLGEQAGGLLQPNRTAVYVDHQGDLLWGGVLSTVSYDTSSGQPVASVAAKDWWGFLSTQRLISASMTNSVDGQSLAYSLQDVLFVAQDIVNRAQAVPGGNLNITVPANTSGQDVTVSFDLSQHLQLGQAISQLAQQSGLYGFDYAIGVAWNPAFQPGQPLSPSNQPIVKQLAVGWPRLGLVAADWQGNGIMFNAGSSACTGVTWQVDGTSSGNTVYGSGSGSGGQLNTAFGTLGGALTSVQSYGPAVAGGWPLTEVTLQRTDIVYQQILDMVTSAELAAVGYPVPTPTFTFKVDSASPVIGSWDVADDCRAVIPVGDPFFPAGVDEIMRVVTNTFTVSDDGTSTVAVELNLPPLF